ncbi:unnamed protein product [Calypogeia fissa]
MYNRQSIINRRKQPPSKKNQENIDIEYNAEMSDLRLMQQSYQDKEIFVRNIVSPKREVVQESQHKWREIMEAQLEEKERQQQQESETEVKEYCYNEYIRRFVGPHSIEGEASRESARREYMKEIMYENMKIAADKVVWQKMQREKDNALDNYHLNTPCTWNRRHYM